MDIAVQMLFFAKVVEEGSFSATARAIGQSPSAVSRQIELLEDEDIVARKLAPIRRLCCAAPDYIARHGVPQRPEDLVNRNCLTTSAVMRWNDWRFDTPDGPKTIHVTGNFQVNSSNVLYHAALAGIGIAWLSTYLVEPDIRAGRLVHLLPQHQERVAALYVVYADRRNLSPKIRSFVDYLVNAIGETPPWERTDAS